MPTTRAQENVSNAVTIPNSSIAPASVIPVKITKKTKKTSVQHLNEDLAAEAADPPLKVTHTEHVLEDSGISVAPPQKDQSATATIPPPPARQISGCVHQSDIAHISAKSAEIIPTDNIASPVKSSSELLPSVKSSSELLPSEITVGYFNSGSGSDSGSPEEIPSELLSPEITGNHFAFGSESGSEFDNKSENMLTPHKVADGKRPRSNSSISPSASHHAKSGWLSVAHSSATSESVTYEPTPASLQSDPPVIEDELQGSSKVTGGFSCGCTVLYNMADKDNEMEIDFATPQPICGKVLFYLDRSPDAIPHTSMHQDIQSKLGPILEKLSGHYSSVAKSNPYIFVNEDNIWSVKGRYAKAIIENETIDWIASLSGQLTLCYFKYYHKAFPSVFKYPELEKWLKGDPTAKSTLEVWGPYKPSFGNIPIIVKEYLAEIAEKKRMQDKEKEKEKKKSTKHSKKNLM
ncbi:hypothetical protein BDQ12DRAFT_665768 [Crucibulum laeve]|uniref:Uncharacterized protein n=1 Tax=Crucibulum laeve TaxID=68775 RepID=A0A5C3M2L3_9AGAR|nr:hypothetical protein BDQ12DRAFT_665768 [Crucibulum laeve]